MQFSLTKAIPVSLFLFIIACNQPDQQVHPENNISSYDPSTIRQNENKPLSETSVQTLSERYEHSRDSGSEELKRRLVLPEIADVVTPAAEPYPGKEQGLARSVAPPGLVLGSIRAPTEPVNRENYTHFNDNPVKRASEQPVSTFSIDVDTGSYAIVRRFLKSGTLPFRDAVRAEEMLNYFSYDYPVPQYSGTPFSLVREIAPTP